MMQTPVVDYDYDMSTVSAGHRTMVMLRKIESEQNNNKMRGYFEGIERENYFNVVTIVIKHIITLNLCVLSVLSLHTESTFNHGGHHVSDSCRATNYHPASFARTT